MRCGAPGEHDADASPRVFLKKNLRFSFDFFGLFEGFMTHSKFCAFYFLKRLQLVPDLYNEGSARVLIFKRVFVRRSGHQQDLDW